MRNEWTRTEQENFAKKKSYSTNLVELTQAVFFSYQYSNAMYKKIRDDYFSFFIFETSLDITGNHRWPKRNMGHLWRNMRVWMGKIEFET